MDIRDIKTEVFFPVKDYEGFYEVSNFGSVRKVVGGKFRYLKHTLRSDGYTMVQLNNGKNVKALLTHRVVALSMLSEGMSEEKCYVNHRDGDKHNNHVSNLEWVTLKENNKHSWRVGLTKGRKGIDNPSSNFTEEQLELIKECLDKGVLQKTIAEAFYVSQTTISNFKRGVHYSE